LGFKEKLPENCPPPNSHTKGCGEAYRLIPNDKPIFDDFASYGAKNVPLPDGMDLCRWSSCSLYADMATVQKKRKLPKLRGYPFVAKLKIAASSGHILEKSKHIDFWMFDTFDPVAAVVAVECL
jgi:hypothetical protein